MFNRKLVTFSILSIYFCTPSIQSHAHNIDYNTSILGSRDITEQNTSYNIEKGRLLNTYINSLQREIETISRDHYIQNMRLNNISDELRKMSTALTNTLTIHYENHHAIGIYDSIIQKIKTLKTDLSTILKNELESSAIKLKVSRQEKNKKSLIVSNKFNNFVNIFTPKVRSLPNSEKKKLILSSITVINIESSKLALFSTREFSTQRQMDEYYSNSLRSIKRELQKIQAIIQ